MSKRLTLRIPEELHTRLCQAAARGGFRSGCALVRVLLMQYLRLRKAQTQDGLWGEVLGEIPSDDSAPLPQGPIIRKAINERL